MLETKIINGSRLKIVLGTNIVVRIKGRKIFTSIFLKK